MLVLNVDDDIDDREMFCEALKTVDPLISCVLVDSGFKALDFLAASGRLPDYIFIDINMPKMNGYECVEEIRLIPGTKNIPIVMFSTTFNPADQMDFTKLGIQYLNKCSRFSELVESMKGIISSQGVRELEAK